MLSNHYSREVQAKMARGFRSKSRAWLLGERLHSCGAGYPYRHGVCFQCGAPAVTMALSVRCSCWALLQSPACQRCADALAADDGVLFA